MTVARSLPLARQALAVRRHLLAGFVAGIVALVAWLVAMYPSIRGRAEFKELLDKYPKELLAFFGGAANLDLTSPAGYLRVELLSFMAPIVLLVLSIGAGAGVVAGEEEAGRLELVLAHPVSRRRVVAEGAVTVAASVALATAALWCVLVVGARAVGMDVAVSRLAAGCAAVGVLALVFGLVALAVGAAVGRRSVAIAVSTVLAVAAYVVSALAELIVGIRPLRVLSPFRETVGLDPLGTGFHPLPALAVLAAAATVTALGAVVFEHRDLH